MCKIFGYHARIFKIFPYRGSGETPLPHPRFGPPFTNTGCTTVTSIAKGHKAMPPVDWSKIYFQKGRVGDIMPPMPNNGISCARKCYRFHTRIFKNLPTVGGENPPTTPSPAQSLRFLASPPPPPLTNPGCTTVMMKDDINHFRILRTFNAIHLNIIFFD